MEPSDHDKLRRDLFRHARAMMRRLGSQEAEDAVQETFYRGLKEVGELTGCDHEPRCTRPFDCTTVFPQWASGTLKNVVREAFRQHERQRRLQARLEVRESMDAQCEMSDEEVRQVLEEILVSRNGRGQRQYEAFCLRQLDGLDRTAVAKKMGISPKTVDNLFARAKKKLLDALKHYRDLGDWPGKDQ
ncbi:MULTISPECIES: RNA polymerase sigma factor [Actinomadura]|uniref:Sigma-70, region 4 n=1 Tax=Actinomadura madurae TaxID=1993 RepID=A0A1I5MAF0_9ACTN|nr:sigma-70 family RNA polymerase sigma factor [Actinomadura madurae]SFP06525.1 Sigma-70, region 4 [Actinomadura madurae]SPT60945.1 Probable RNA polymerase sigma factor fecI [Actinomadura madurae]